MKIQFESLKEIKEFILMVDIYQLCDRQPEWGGLGYIISNRYTDSVEKQEVIVTIPEDSKVIRRCDKFIITPYYKQISWLFETLYHFTMYGKELNSDVFLDNFQISFEAYFIMNPGHSAKEIMIFVLDGLKRLVDASREEHEEKQ